MSNAFCVRARQQLLLCAALITLTALAGCTKQPERPASGNPVALGVVTIETGEGAAYGTYTKNGLDLALSEMPDTPVRLIYKDSKQNPQEAMRVFGELRAASVPLVIGPFTSTESKQVGPEAQRLGIVMITTSATADYLSETGDHVFMMLPPNSKQGDDQAKFAVNRLHAKRAIILYRQNDYGQSLRKSFASKFAALGGQVMQEEAFPDNAEDFRDHLRKLASTKADVFFVAAHDEDTGRILRQAREVRFPPMQVLGGDGSMSPAMLQLAGGAAEGSIFSNVAAVDPKFEAAYRAKYGTDPSGYSATAYDTLKIIAQFVREGITTSDGLQKSLVGLQGYTGASGLTKFTQIKRAYWCLEKEYRQFAVKGDRFELVH